MLTRLWKYAEPAVLRSEYLLHASVFSMVEFDEDIFAAGNCYDQNQYKVFLSMSLAFLFPVAILIVCDYIFSFSGYYRTTFFVVIANYLQLKVYFLIKIFLFKF